MIFGVKRNFLKISRNFKNLNFARFLSTSKVPESADVVIIGGGSAGCNLLYQLSKQNVNAVLIERGKLTSGTTWHTAGVVWSLRPNDTDIQLLAITQKVLSSLEEETGHNPGWINNGGIFISHSPQRTNEYRRLQTLGKCFSVPSEIMTSHEAKKIFPLLDPNSYEHALYSPNDGVVDPAMMCNALSKGAIKNGAKVVEDCPVEELLVGENFLGDKEVKGVRTKFGTIKANAVVNATGVWGRNLLEPHGISLPLVPMRHAYVVSETIEGVRGMPNVRDHDFSLYFRVQGQAISMGGYEPNPILLHNVPLDFQFQLYDLDYSCFDTHIEGAVKLCPAFGEAGIKSTVCGPETFTIDHRAIMGPDPFLHNLFHSCGFNSVGMMFGAGCANQLASWMIKGRPDLNMWAYDVRRFTEKQRKNYEWAVERSHEAYARNYNIVFPNDQPLAGRNFVVDPFYELMLASGAVMEEKAGFERSGFFATDGKRYDIPKYDFYGSYGHERNKNQSYEKKISGDYKFEFSDHHEIIGAEARTCRDNVALFNLSYFTKFFIVGPEAADAVRWIFTANIADREENRVIYTCALNARGGVEADLTVTPIDSPSTIDPNFNSRAFYCIAGGLSGTHTIAHVREGILEKKFDAKVLNVTEDFGILSLQGRNSGKILSKIAKIEDLKQNCAKVVEIEGAQVKILRVSFVGEFGFELHIPKEKCVEIYRKLMKVGEEFELKNAGFRALYSLSCEKGTHLWSQDLRSDDSPLDANLSFTCRNPSDFRGKSMMEKKKNLIFVTLEDEQKIPLWGLEAVYRNGKILGHLRRGDWSFTHDRAIGYFYVENSSFDENFFDGNFKVEALGKLFNAKAHLKSPFDPKGKRLQGKY